MADLGTVETHKISISPDQVKNNLFIVTKSNKAFFIEKKNSKDIRDDMY